ARYLEVARLARDAEDRDAGAQGADRLAQLDRPPEALLQMLTRLGVASDLEQGDAQVLMDRSLVPVLSLGRAQVVGRLVVFERPLPLARRLVDMAEVVVREGEIAHIPLGAEVIPRGAEVGAGEVRVPRAQRHSSEEVLSRAVVGTGSLAQTLHRGEPGRLRAFQIAEREVGGPELGVALAELDAIDLVLVQSGHDRLQQSDRFA